jgi:hypothetical protein
MKNNINMPIIVDFEHSFLVKDFDTTDSIEKKVDYYRPYFSKYTEHYKPWCIDIYFLTYMFSKLSAKIEKKEWYNEKVSKEIVDEILSNYFDRPDTDFLHVLFKQADKVEKIKNYFIDRYVGVDKLWKFMFEDLLKNTSSWDNYSITIMYFYVLKTYNLSTLPNAYIELLYDIVLSVPNERVAITIKDCISKIQNIFYNQSILFKTTNVPPSIIDTIRMYIFTESKQEEKLETNIE